MGARFRSILVVAIVLVVTALIIAAYRFGWSGTGFLNKSLWDWLQLLIIPLALAVIALVFQLANARTERQIAKERYEQDQQIALDKQQGDILQAYLDRMSDLLLKEDLLTSQSDQVRNVARVRTITVLHQLDGKRVGFVFAFLREAGLMSKQPNESVMSLREANLRTVNWRQAFLYDANLSKTNLRWANLNGVILSGANLSEAILYQADLSEANLYQADLSEANLIEADLSKAFLYQADLSKTNLSGAKLVEANLNSINLSEANLSGANLKDAMNITIEELEKQTWSLKGATMPDGSIHP